MRKQRPYTNLPDLGLMQQLVTWNSEKCIVQLNVSLGLDRLHGESWKRATHFERRNTQSYNGKVEEIVEELEQLKIDTAPTVAKKM